MADNLRDIFSSIANSIRSKKGTTNTIKPANMSAEIDSISTGTDTSDATATSNDILLGKTAYIGTGKVQGTIPTYDGSYENGVECSSSSNGGASLNVLYGTTPPNDIDKIWIAANKPISTEIQTKDITIDDYLIGEVQNLGTIENTFAGSGVYFDSQYYTFCYMEDYKIVTLHYRKILVYDLKLQEFVFTYDCSSDIYNDRHGISAMIYKNNTLYFMDSYSLFSFNFNTNDFTKVVDFSTDTHCLEVLNNISYSVGYMFFYNDNEIDFLGHRYGQNNCHFRYNVKTKVCQQIAILDGTSIWLSAFGEGQHSIKVNNYVYSFRYDSDILPGVKYNISNHTIEEFTSFKEFVGGQFGGTSVFYDNEKFIYLIGGGYNSARSTIARYNILTDTFEDTEIQLLGAKSRCLSFYINNRAYMFGGSNSNRPTGYGTRLNKLDYFDIYYPLTNNNAMMVINPIKVDNAYKLIDSEDLKLYRNVKNVYIGNSDNQAQKVNIYQYNILSSTNDSYSSITFNKNSIVNNFSRIVDKINSTNNQELTVIFGGNESSIKYMVMIMAEGDHIMSAVVDEKFNYITVFAIASNGTLEENYQETPCTWTTGDSTTITFDSNLEVNTLIDIGVATVTPQELTHLGICTFETIKGEIVGK